MICPNCGKKFDKKGNFCSKCGTSLVEDDAPEASKFLQPERTVEVSGVEASVPQTNTVEPVNREEIQNEAVKPAEEFPDWVIGDVVEIKPGINQAESSPIKKVGKICLIVAGALCLLIIVAFVVISALLNRKVTISPADYMVVSFEGYSSIGKSTVEFNYDEFKKDYPRIKVNKSELQHFLIFSRGLSAAEAEKAVNSVRDGNPELFFAMCTSGYLDKTSGLSNGDVIFYFYEIPVEEIERCFNVSIKREVLSITVSNLKEVELYDPFDLVDVKFVGCSPYLMLDIDKSRLTGEYENLGFITYDTEKLRNGDEITITPMLYCSKEVYISKYNRVPDLSPKTFTVEGRSEWVNNAQNIPGRMYNEMKTRADIEISKMAQNWNTGEVLKNSDYIGYYFLTVRDKDTLDDFNRCYFIYKLTVEITQYDCKKKKDVTEECTFFYYVGFSDLYIDEMGNEVFDNEVYIPFWVYNYTTSITISNLNQNVYYVFTAKGMDKFKTLFEDVVGSNYETHTYDDCVFDPEFVDFEHQYYGSGGYSGYYYGKSGGYYIY